MTSRDMARMNGQMINKFMNERFIENAPSLLLVA